jgi:hypothetical protein
MRPPNSAQLLILEGRGANTSRTVYTTPDRFEFFAPSLAWQGSERLFLVRSRFAPGGEFALDRFGLAAVQLPPPDSPGAAVALLANYALPDQKTLRDVAPCRDGQSSLFVAADANGNLEIDRWDLINPPQPLFGLPPHLTRIFLCWRG